MRIYCPCCGEWDGCSGIDLIPGEVRWTCTACQTMFAIRFDFFEVQTTDASLLNINGAGHGEDKAQGLFQNKGIG